MNNVQKNFDILATNLNNLRNYFNSSIKLLYPAKILDLSTKPFFPCKTCNFLISICLNYMLFFFMHMYFVCV